jgi:hypothetical protein
MFFGDYSVGETVKLFVLMIVCVWGIGASTSLLAQQKTETMALDVDQSDATRSDNEDLKLEMVVSDIEIPNELNDAAFEQFVSSKLISKALRGSNASLLADVGIQLHDGEVSLFREHNMVGSKAVFEMAMEIAGRTNDGKTMERLDRFYSKQSLEELKATSSQISKLMGESRRVSCELPNIENLTDLQEQVIQIVKEDLELAVARSDRKIAEELIVSLNSVPVFDEVELGKLVQVVKSVRDSLPDTPPGSKGTNELLEKLSGASRGSVSRGPKYAGNAQSVYPIGDEKVHFAVEVVNDLPHKAAGGKFHIRVPFDDEILPRAWKAAENQYYKKKRATHIWDDKWYYTTLPAIDRDDKKNRSAQKHWLITAMTFKSNGKRSIAYGVIVNTPNWWYVQSNNKADVVKNGQQVKYRFTLNGHRMDLDFKNPKNTSGWTSNDIWYSFGY